MGIKRLDVIDMARVSNEPLKPNPFFTYRDPETGVWRVVEEIATTPSSSTKVKTNSQASSPKSA